MNKQILQLVQVVFQFIITWTEYNLTCKITKSRDMFKKIVFHEICDS